jgi:hypothetical protein
MKKLLLIVTAIVFTGCPGISEGPAVGPCKVVSAKCKLSYGPLGVCIKAPCAEGKTAPCFVCQSQH